MKLSKFNICAAACALVFLAGCARQQNFTSFFAKEVSAIGGQTNHFDTEQSLYGKWKIKRDGLGAAIDVKGIRFEVITNLLTAAYGHPQFYCPANPRHGPTYVYPASRAGISIFVSGTEHGAEITLTKPLSVTP